MPTAIWSGELRFGDLVLKCHVLDDGRRVVEEESVDAFLAWISSGSGSLEDVCRFATEYTAWMRGKGAPR